MTLTPAQSTAINFIREHAVTRRENARSKIAHVLEMSNVTTHELENALSAISSHARVALHFHPDRIDGQGSLVADSLLTGGRYKSQFETLLSNGKLSPQSGGPRDHWENRMFGDAYSGCPAEDRPKYGALDLMLLPDGPCPRFGSCYFLLKPTVLERCTFTYMDSHLAPLERGTLGTFDDIICALLTDSFEREFSLGVSGIRPKTLINHLTTKLGQPFEDPSAKPAVRNLDFYIEAQIHGNINLQEDVDFLVVDPSFAKSEVGAILGSICERFDIELLSHCGFLLHEKNVPSDFRGAHMPLLAAKLSQDGFIDAKLIGDAARDLTKNPNAWKELGTYEDVVQQLKFLWHVLVKFGSPFV